MAPCNTLFYKQGGLGTTQLSLPKSFEDFCQVRLEDPDLSGFLESYPSLENENAHSNNKKQQLLWAVDYQDEDPLRITQPMNPMDYKSCSTLHAAHVFTSPQNFPLPQEMFNPL